MKMADTPKARVALLEASALFESAHSKLRYHTGKPLSRSDCFTLLWDLSYQIYHSLEEHRIPDENHAKHYDLAICDDAVTERNKPYKGSDSVPF